MSVDSSMNRHATILNSVLKWKALPTSVLRDVSGYAGHKRSFNRVLNQLEKSELVQSMRFNGATKLIYPSKLLIQMNPSSNVVLDDHITHDGFCSIVVNELLQWELFNDAKFPHEAKDGKYNEGLYRVPDAILSGATKNHRITLALEIELTRKSKLRVKNKLSDYANNSLFEYVLYVFNDRATFKAYQNILTEFINKHADPEVKKSISARFILVLKENIISHKLRLDEAEVFYFGKETELLKIFGTRKRVI